MFVETGYIYTFVYKIIKDGQIMFYILKIAPNLSNCIETFQKYLQNNSTKIKTINKRI